MFQRKKAKPNELYYQYLLGDAKVSSYTSYIKVHSTAFQEDKSPRAQKHKLLCEWLNVPEDKQSDVSFIIEKQKLQAFFSAPTSSPAVQQWTELEMPGPSNHPRREKSIIKMPLPLFVIERADRQEDEKKSVSDSTPEVIRTQTISDPDELNLSFITKTKSLTAAQQKEQLKRTLAKHNKSCSIIKFIFTSYEKDTCLRFMNGLHSETLLTLPLEKQIELLQFSAEKSPEIFAALMTRAPYHAFKKAFRRHSSRSDRRTAYHDAAQCLSPTQFLKLIRESHAKDPNRFFRMLTKKDIDGRTVLHLAAQYQTADVLLELLTILRPHKNSKALLSLTSYDDWNIISVVLRFQPPAVFTAVLNLLPADFIVNSITEDVNAHWLFSLIAFKDGMLEILSNRLGKKTFIAVFNQQRKKGNSDSVIWAMCSIRNFTSLEKIMGRITIIDILTEIIVDEEKLSTFLTLPIASESLCQDVLKHLWLDIPRQAFNVFANAGVFFWRSAKVISILLKSVTPERAEALAHLALTQLINNSEITRDEKIELIEKLDLRFILAPSILSLLRTEIDQGHLESCIKKWALKENESGSSWFQEAIATLECKAAEQVVQQLSEMKDEHNFMNTALIQKNKKGETLIQTALKKRNGIAEILLQIAPKKVVRFYIANSTENLLTLSMECSLDTFIAMVKKLEEVDPEYFEKYYFAISAFDKTHRNLDMASLLKLLNFIRTQPCLLRMDLDKRVRDSIVQHPTETLSHEKFPITTIEMGNFVKDLEAKHWKLLVPYFSSADSMGNIMYCCSDSMMITLTKNAKDTFLAHIGIQAAVTQWNLLHSLLYFRNNKTVLAVLNNFNDQDWKKLDAVLSAKNHKSETCLQFVCLRDEKVFELFVLRSSTWGLSNAIRESAESNAFLHFLAFALPKQTPAVIALLLLKIRFVFESILANNYSNHGYDQLYYQLACYLVHEPGWSAVLNPLFQFFGPQLKKQLDKLPYESIPDAVKHEMKWVKSSDKHDEHAKEARFFKMPLDEKKTDRYVDELAHMNTLIKSHRLAIKIILDKNWQDFVRQLSDYYYRPELRKKIEKSGLVFKFFHLEKDEARKIRVLEYKKKSEFTTTKKQAVSLVSQTLATTVFGEHHSDYDLVGVLIEINVKAIKAMFFRDKGTFYRAWVSKDKGEVEQYQRDIQDYNCTDFETFCAEIEKYPQRLNEMLMQLTRESIKAIVVAKASEKAIQIARQRQLDLKKIAIDVPIVYYDRLARAMRPLNDAEYASEQTLKM